MAEVGGVQITREALWSFDLAEQTVRDLNARLHSGPSEPSSNGAGGRVVVLNPGGRHAIAVGLDAPYVVDIEGHVGYYLIDKGRPAFHRVFAYKAPWRERLHYFVVGHPSLTYFGSIGRLG